MTYNVALTTFLKSCFSVVLEDLDFLKKREVLLKMATNIINFQIRETTPFKNISKTYQWHIVHLYESVTNGATIRASIWL